MITRSLHVFLFCIQTLHTIVIGNISINTCFVLFCFYRLYNSLVAMDPFKTNLASLHYVTFIKPYVVMPTESL
jgi:hypothetical protein